MKHYTPTPFALFTIWICLVFLGINQSATADGEIVCKVPYCGKISNTPKTTLLSVNPNPLATVDLGDPQNVVVKWSVRFGLRAKFELCATDSLSSGPQNNDPCTTLPGATVVNNGFKGNTYEDTLSLSSAFYQPTAEFYIQTTSLIYFSQGSPSISFSNRLGFVWPLNMPNLYPRNPMLIVSGGTVQLRQDIENRGAVGAGASHTNFVFDVCDGLAMLTLSDPDDPNSERVCTASNAHYLFFLAAQQNVNSIPAGFTESNFTDMTNMFPYRKFGYRVTVTVAADAGQVVDESNEIDNIRFETEDISP